MMIRVLVLAFATILSTAFATPVWAQGGPVTGVIPVKFGQKVWVTSADGTQAIGVVTQLTDTAIELSGDAGDTRIKLTDVRSVAVKDSNWSGFWAGFSVGAGATLLLAGSGFGSDCGSNCRSQSRINAPVLGMAALIGLAYGGVGALCDALIQGQDIVWENKSARRVSLSPIVAPKTVGVGGAIRW